MPTQLSGAEASVQPASFTSILAVADGDTGVAVEEPAYFKDLNLDQLVDSILESRQEYDLAPFYYTRLTSPDAVAYRHEVLHDLEDPTIAAAVKLSAQRFREMRNQLDRARRFHYEVQRQAGFLAAVVTYVEAVKDLAAALTEAPTSSRGMTSLVRYLNEYVASAQFRSIVSDVVEVKARLAQVRYRLHIQGDRVHVSRGEELEDDYAADVTATFERFQQGPAHSHLSKLRSYVEMDHVEAQIIGMVARLYPDPFAALEAFSRDHASFADPALTTFDREVQFYLAYLEFVARLRSAGLRFCYPEVTDTPAQAQVIEGFDPALADKLVREETEVVCNDFYLRDRERIVVVTGPNQGGKTTFARMVAEVYHLASLGLLIPGTEGRLSLVDGIFTHFERGENLHDLTGKLEDDLVRIRDILEHAGPNSLVIINEIFTSTSLEDASLLATRVLEQLDDHGCLCVCVTFLDELTTVRPDVVSMVSTVRPEDPASRTFKVVRQAADGLAYAEVLAHKYGLTYAQVKGRLSS